MITNKTRLACLLASPISLSLSPQLQNELFTRYQKEGCYLAFETKKEELKRTLESLKQLNFIGANVSSPLKQAVLPFLDELTPHALLAESVNTIYNQHGKLIGTSTDGEGFFSSLPFSVQNKTLYLLGGGGATLAILSRAKEYGVNTCYVLQRENERFYALQQKRKEISQKTGLTIVLVPFTKENLYTFLKQEIIVNATTLGMKQENFLPEGFHFATHQKVVELIYAVQTPFLKQAKKDGAMIVNGLPMLIEQGILSFEFWTNAHVSKQTRIALIKKIKKGEDRK